MTSTIREPQLEPEPERASTADTRQSDFPLALSVSRLARWLLVMCVAIFTVRMTVDPDLFWHLRTGEWILDNGIPRTDVFSHTRSDNSWVTHEWLSQILAWSAYSVGGFAAVSLMFAALGAAVMSFTYRTLDGGPLQKVLLTAAAMFVATISFGARPQLFTLAFAAGFVWLVERVRRGDADARTLWWAVPATLVWANLHSGFVLGVVILATYAVGDWLHRRFFGDDPLALPMPVSKNLLRVALASFAVAVVNPSGPKLWVYPFETLRSDAMRTLIAEWHSPDFHLTIVRPFLAMVVLGAAVFAVSKRRPTVTDLLLFCGTVTAGMISLRHIGVAAIVSMPVLARHLSSATEGTRAGQWLSGERDHRFGVAPIFTAVVAVVLAFVVVMKTTTTWATNDATIAERYPVAAVDWIKLQGLDAEPGYNSYGWGGYLIWNDIEVFSDGRADVYGDEFLWEVVDLSAVDREWEETLAKYGVTWAVMPVERSLATAMLADPDWELAYEDDVALVITRVG